MRIEIKGRNKFLCKNEVKFAVGYFATKLMGIRLAKTLDLEIIFTDLTGVGDGYCHPYEVGRSPKMFEISIDNKMQRYKQLQVLAHELVHVKQYAKNELRSDDSTSASFAGKTYRLTPTLEDYLDWPWEIEAFGREKGLYCLYQILLRQEKIKFKRGKMYMGGKYVKIGKEK